MRPARSAARTPMRPHRVRRHAEIPDVADSTAPVLLPNPANPMIARAVRNPPESRRISKLARHDHDSLFRRFLDASPGCFGSHAYGADWRLHHLFRRTDGRFAFAF